MEMNIDLALEILGNIFGRGKGFIDYEYEAWKFLRSYVKKAKKSKTWYSAQQHSKTLPQCKRKSKIIL